MNRRWTERLGAAALVVTLLALLAGAWVLAQMLKGLREWRPG